MKTRLIGICIALIMLFSAFVTVASADGEQEEETQSCTVQTINVASLATFSTRTDCSILTEHYEKLVDGDYSTGAGSSNEYEDNGVHRFFTFDSPINVTKLVIYCNYEGEDANVSDDPELSAMRNLDKNYIMVCHPSYESNTNRICQISFSSKGTTKVEWSSETWYNKPVQCIEIWNSVGNDASFIIYEVEIYTELGEHVWEFDGFVSDATCTEPGVVRYVCECGETKEEETVENGHAPGFEWSIDEVAGTHYLTCETDGCGARIDEAEHVYDNACDASCDLCAYERDIPGHEYKFDCSTECMHECGYVRTALTAHTVDGACDVECNACGEATGTSVEHSYTDSCDANCDGCGLERTPPHAFASSCDVQCDNCKLIREPLAEHSYNSPCDTDCNNCSEQRVAPAEHAFSGDCDSTCNTSGCGYEREPLVTHTYSSDCDRTCNKCSYAREVSGHVYDNDCDDTCNVDKCGYMRTVSDHVYDNNCDTTCNKCGRARTASLHNYGSWVEFQPSTTKNTGLEKRTCVVCGNEELRDTPVKEKSSNVGMIVAIVVSCVVVIGGCAGTAVYFLVIKKK